MMVREIARAVSPGTNLMLAEKLCHGRLVFFTMVSDLGRRDLSALSCIIIMLIFFCKIKLYKDFLSIRA